MLRKSIIALAVASLTVITANSFAQEPPKPGPEHEKLKEMEGTWDAVMDFNGQQSKATVEYKSICGGLWLQSDFHGDFAGMKFDGHGLDGYNPRSKKYISVWVDSMLTTPMVTEGEFDPKTKTLTMSGEMPSPDGKNQKVKSTLEVKDKDHQTFKMYMVGGDGGEQPMFTIEYTRRK